MYGKYYKQKQNEKTYKDVQKSMSLKITQNKSNRLKKQSIQYDTILVGGRFDNLVCLYQIYKKQEMRMTPKAFNLRVMFQELEKRMPRQQEAYLDVFVTSEANSGPELPKPEREPSSEASSSDEDTDFQTMVKKQKLVAELRNLGIRADFNQSNQPQMKSWISRHV